MKTQILLIKNSPEVIAYLRSNPNSYYKIPGLGKDTYKYVHIRYRDTWYKFRTSSAESQYLSHHRIIGDLSTLHQIDMLKSLGLKDQEIWNQLKEST